MDSSQQSVYPVPESWDAIHIVDGTRYDKKHFTMSVNYEVCQKVIQYIHLAIC
jgi:hypothetical protein